MRKFLREGEMFVWVSAAGLSAVLLMTVTVLLVVLANGLGFFWPSALQRFELRDGSVILGERLESTINPEGGERMRIKVGNRDLYGQDFRWVNLDDVRAAAAPADVIAVERLEYGHFYGFLERLEPGNLEIPETTGEGWTRLEAALRAMALQRGSLLDIEREMSATNERVEQLRLRLAKLSHRQGTALDPAIRAEIERESATQAVRFETLRERFEQLERELLATVAVMRDAGGREARIHVFEIVRAWQPNAMSVPAKARFYVSKVKELLLDDPRESNTEGGIFPAIFGTVMMVFLMSLFSIPFGVLAAIYLREYARDGRFVRLVRIAVNNLAGVPSIVYGVFGLGFFIYTVGSGLDELLFGYRLPTPTFGTGGILWASLTLALLTVPVVIVSTEEALSAIPKEIREGSLALGATKFQTLVRILLPMSTPGIMTGLVLSMARAAGEVAPLMLTGAVKLAPELPLDGQFPYFHLDRKFMHLGFHIYDLAFQSPNVEAVLPMVYVTTMLLLGIVIVLSAAAIWLRERMRRRFSAGTF